jgi:hypothetical protein
VPDRHQLRHRDAAWPSNSPTGSRESPGRNSPWDSSSATARASLPRAAVRATQISTVRPADPARCPRSGRPLAVTIMATPFEPPRRETAVRFSVLMVVLVRRCCSRGTRSRTSTPRSGRGRSSSGLWLATWCDPRPLCPAPSAAHRHTNKKTPNPATIAISRKCGRGVRATPHATPAGATRIGQPLRGFTKAQLTADDRHLVSLKAVSTHARAGRFGPASGHTVLLATPSRRTFGPGRPCGWRADV